MKNKIIALLITICSMAVLVGCGKDSTDISSALGGKREKPKSMPFAMEYNDKEIKAEAFDLYQNEDNNEVNVYGIIKVDLANLDEKEKAWLLKEPLDGMQKATMEYNVKLSNEDNQLDNLALTNIGYRDDGNYRYHYLLGLKRLKYPIDNTNLSLKIDLSQDETYESNTGHKTNNVNTYSCEIAYPGDDKVKTLDDMTVEDKNAFIELMNKL